MSKIEGSHDHAYFLPSDEDGDGRIDHLTVVASGGFPPEETAAFDSLRRLRVGEAEVALQLVGLGGVDDFRTRLFGPARVWRSATPFVVTRHVKARGQKKDPPGQEVRQLMCADSHVKARGQKKDPPECKGIEGRKHFARLVLEEELRRWLDRQGLAGALPEVSELAWDRAETGRRQPAVLEFRRSRPEKRGDDGFRRAVGVFTLTFRESVAGPVCLGHAGHFGLGLFVADG